MFCMSVSECLSVCVLRERGFKNTGRGMRGVIRQRIIGKIV